MTDDYAPFPERQLEDLAKYHDDVASKMQSTFVAGLHTDRANACRNALLSFAALRERCLVAEMRYGQAVMAGLASGELQLADDSQEVA